MDRALLLAAKDIEKGLLTICTNEIIERYEDEHSESRNEIIYGLSIRGLNQTDKFIAASSRRFEYDTAERIPEIGI